VKLGIPIHDPAHTGRSCLSQFCERTSVPTPFVLGDRVTRFTSPEAMTPRMTHIACWADREPDAPKTDLLKVRYGCAPEA